MVNHCYQAFNCHFMRKKHSLNHKSKSSRLFFKTKNLCSQSSCDQIQCFQWLQVVVHHRYVTLVWCHMHWNSQKCLKVMILITNVMHQCSVHPLYVQSHDLIVERIQMQNTLSNICQACMLNRKFISCFQSCCKAWLCCPV